MDKLNSENIRKSFCDFFISKGHKILPSASLIPKDDLSVLLTTAGMQPFKKYFTGELDALKDLGNKNIATVQKCFRTSDIESVGDDTHLTFFEMLGNFSFGGYFKEQAIEYAFEYITKVLNLKIDYVSVFGGSGDIPKDNQSALIWQKLGIKKDNIKLSGIEDNFWGPTGDRGPCGPTTEIYINGIEVWNIVFNEFFCQGDRSALESGKANLQKLPFLGIDTGMGLERLMYVLYEQNSKNIKSLYQTDVFSNSLAILSKATNKDYLTFKKHFHIIADHIRGAVFLISDGVLPSNTKAGYILRRILRRAIRSLMELEILNQEIITKLIQDVIARYQASYPDLIKKQNDILAVIQNETQNFSKSLKKGLNHFNKLISNNKKIISGKEAFYLFQSFGFPLEMIKEIASEKKIKVDENGFKNEYLKHKEISRAKVA